MRGPPRASAARWSGTPRSDRRRVFVPRPPERLQRGAVSLGTRGYLAGPLTPPSRRSVRTVVSWTREIPRRAAPAHPPALGCSFCGGGAPTPPPGSPTGRRETARLPRPLRERAGVRGPPRASAARWSGTPRSDRRRVFVPRPPERLQRGAVSIATRGCLAGPPRPRPNDGAPLAIPRCSSRREGAGLPSMAALRRGAPSPPALMGFDQQPGVSGRLVPDPLAGEHCLAPRPSDLQGETVPRLVRPGGPQHSWGVVPSSTVPLGRRRTNPPGRNHQHEAEEVEHDDPVRGR